MGAGFGRVNFHLLTSDADSMTVSSMFCSSLETYKHADEPERSLNTTGSGKWNHPVHLGYLTGHSDPACEIQLKWRRVWSLGTRRSPKARVRVETGKKKSLGLFVLQHHASLLFRNFKYNVVAPNTSEIRLLFHV